MVTLMDMFKSLHVQKVVSVRSILFVPVVAAKAK